MFFFVWKKKGGKSEVSGLFRVYIDIYIYICRGIDVIYCYIQLCGVYKVLYIFFSTQLCDQCGNCGDYFKKSIMGIPMKEPVLF